MKIFYITHTFNLEPKGGGGEIYCANLLNELLKRGHEILVFAPQGRIPKKNPKGLKIHFSPILGHHALHKFEYVLNAAKAVKLAKEFKPDIVHAQNDVFPALIGKKIKHSLGVPLLVGIEYLSQKSESINTFLLFHLNRLFLKHTDFDLLVSMSQYNIDNYLKKWGIPLEKIKMIPNGVDTKKFSPQKPAKELIEKYGKHLIISLKPLHSTNTKGIELIIKAMKGITKKHPEFNYLVFGNGPGKKQLKALVQKLKLQKNVFFLDNVAYEKTPRVYNSAEIMVHSFTFEATASMSLLDSMACGNAIVATNIGEIKNVVEDSALLVKPFSAKAIEKAVLKLIKNPKLRKKKAQKARALAVKKYSIEKIATEFEKAYNELIEGKAKNH